MVLGVPAYINNIKERAKALFLLVLSKKSALAYVLE